MLGVPSPSVSARTASSGTVDQVLGHARRRSADASGDTLAVSVAVIATLVVFERWIKAIPGGLVAVVGAIAVSWIFDLAAPTASRSSGRCRAACRTIGFPQRRHLDRRAELLATAVSMFLVILAQSAATSRAYAVKYKERSSRTTTSSA